MLLVLLLPMLTAADATCCCLHSPLGRKRLNEVCWSFIDHKLSQSAQQDVFRCHLWGRVRPSAVVLTERRKAITAAEFKRALEVFSPDSNALVDLLESITQDKPGEFMRSSLATRTGNAADCAATRLCQLLH